MIMSTWEERQLIRDVTVYEPDPLPLLVDHLGRPLRAPRAPLGFDLSGRPIGPGGLRDA